MAWAGKPEEQLRQISGLGLRFCHPSRFLITADDKATAIEACRHTAGRRKEGKRMSAEGSEIYGPAPSTAADREPTPAPAWSTCAAGRQPVRRLDQ